MQSAVKRHFIVLALLVAVVFSGCQFFPSYDPVSVRVTVRDPSGAPIQDAAISLLGSQDFGPNLTAGNGTAALSDVAPDNYLLTVLLPNGGGITRSIPLWGGENYDITVDLQAIEDHLVAAWSFDEMEGNVAYNSVSNRHHGQLVGNVQRIAGVAGQGIRFNGGRIDVANSAEFNLGTGMTVALWVNLSNPDKDQKVIGRTTTSNGFVLGVQNSKLYPELWDSNGTRYKLEHGSINENEWTHLVVTWQTGGELIGYVNGERVGAIDAGRAPMRDNNEVLRMGAGPWSPGSFLVEGAIDDVRIYDRALSQAEIQAIYGGDVVAPD